METGSQLLIRVYNFKPLETGNLRAFCSVDLGKKIKIHSCRIIQQPNQLAWPSLPQASWADPEGQIRYYRIVELPKSVEHAVKKAILKAWQEFDRDPA